MEALTAPKPASVVSPPSSHAAPAPLAALLGAAGWEDVEISAAPDLCFQVRSCQGASLEGGVCEGLGWLLCFTHPEQLQARDDKP